MGLIFREKRWVFTRVARLAIVCFVMALGLSFGTTIWAVYLDSFLNNVSLVGFVSALFSLVAVISYFLFIPLIEKIDKEKILAYSLLALVASYLLFSINDRLSFLIIITFVFVIANTFRVTSLGIIIKDKSSKKNLSRNEGLIYSFQNLSWVIAPLIAGFVAVKFGISAVFIISSILILFAFFVFSFSRIKDKTVKKRLDKNMWRNFIDFFKNKDRSVAYLLKGGVGLWWTLVYLFMPLFIIRQGLGTEWIGYFLFAIPIPLILFEYSFAKLAGKVGFKKMFKLGFLIPCILVFACFFISNIYTILLLFVLASLGFAMLEPTTEAYFFDILKGKERLRFYGPYSTSIDLSKLLAKVLPAILLMFFPFKYIFLLFGFIMFLMFLISFKTRSCIRGVGFNINFIF